MSPQTTNAVLPIEQIIEVVLALVIIAILAYKFWKSRAKLNEIKEACKAAINAQGDAARARNQGSTTYRQAIC